MSSATEQAPKAPPASNGSSPEEAGGAVGGEAVEALLDALARGRYVPTDPAGTITKWTGAAAAAFGWSDEEVTGRTLLEAPLSLGPGRILTRDGAARAVELTVVPIGLSEGFEFNVFLGDLGLDLEHGDKLARLRGGHPRVLETLQHAVDGAAAEPAEGERLAGRLIVFTTSADAPEPDPALVARAAGLRIERPDPEPLAGLEPADGPAVLTLVDALDHLERARTAARAARADADALQEELDAARAAQADADALREQLEAARAAEGELEASATRTAALQAEIDRLNSELEASREKIAALKAELDAARPARAQLEALEARAARVLDGDAPATGTAREGFDDVTRPLARINARSGRFTAINAAFSELVGYTESEFRWVSWPPPADHAHREELREAGRRLLAGEITAAPVETHYMHAQGLLVPIVGELYLDESVEIGDSFLLAVEPREAQ